MTKAEEFCNLIVLDLSDLGGVKEQCVVRLCYKIQLKHICMSYYDIVANVVSLGVHA